MGFTGISDENQLVVGSCIQRVAYFICAKVLTLSAALNVIHHMSQWVQGGWELPNTC